MKIRAARTGSLRFAWGWMCAYGDMAPPADGNGAARTDPLRALPVTQGSHEAAAGSHCYRFPANGAEAAVTFGGLPGITVMMPAGVSRAAGLVGVRDCWRHVAGEVRCANLPCGAFRRGGHDKGVTSLRRATSEAGA